MKTWLSKTWTKLKTLGVEPAEWMRLGGLHADETQRIPAPVAQREHHGERPGHPDNPAVGNRLVRYAHDHRRF